MNFTLHFMVTPFLNVLFGYRVLLVISKISVTNRKGGHENVLPMCQPKFGRRVDRTGS